MYRIVKNKTFSITTSPAYSDTYNLLIGGSFSMHVVYTSGAGTGVLQYSNDGTNFVDVTDSSQTFSGSMSAFYDVLQTGAASVRIKFTSSTGMSGTIYSVGGSN